MQTLLHHLRAWPDRYLLLVILILFFPAHLINLGVAAFNGDEAIRAWVAMEMDFSGNYIATTMHGAPYINKPPLFNWMILGVTKLFGGFHELPSRLVTVFFLCVFGYTVFRIVCRHFETDFALLAAMTTITSGRFLFYDSMLGLIDTTFTWVTYLLFMSIWYLGKRGEWLRLFLASYFLMAVGFLLKAFPAVVFQGLSLLAGLIYFGQWRQLFSWRHFLGIAVAVAIIGAWLGIYVQYRPLEVLIPNLVEESVKRTAVEHSFSNTIYHIAKFPFDSIYHFLPYSLLLVFWLDKNFWKRIRQNEFVLFNFLILAVNLPVYWTSSQVMARYLLMFIPLFNVIGLYLLTQHRAENTWRSKAFYWMMGSLLALGPVATLAMPFIKEVNWLQGIWPMSIVLTLALALVVVMYFVDKARFLWWFVIGMLVVRIGFDLIILPVRHHENDTSIARRDAIQMAEKHSNRRWYVWADSETREPAMFYATERLGYIIERTDDMNIPNALYLVNLRQYPNFDGRCLDTLRTDYKTTTLLLMVRE
ncbi:MAG: glycosyltransferase family 39 protein [Saprospiraceae bacterium]|nr:glycosyltransferase family 39 protein [Saprospiraceae bacterium]